VIAALWTLWAATYALFVSAGILAELAWIRGDADRAMLYGRSGQVCGALAMASGGSAVVFG
jgi:hypothetical protein